MGIREWLESLFCNRYKLEFQKAVEHAKHLIERIVKLENQINELTAEPELPPKLELYDKTYKGQRTIFSKQGSYSFSLKPTEYFIPTSKLDWLVNNYKISEAKTDFEKFCLALRAVNEKLRYEYDSVQYGKSDYFSFSFEVVTTKKDDCESLSFVVMDTYLRAGGSPEKIFIGYGLYKNTYGHAYPVFRDEDGVYWIGEATLSTYRVPIQWSVLKDTYSAVWGMANKLWSCRPKGGKKYVG